MAATLPPLEPLFRRSAKRTWDVFASEPDAGLGDEEERCVFLQP
jgi:pleiotropic regulator 1